MTDSLPPLPPARPVLLPPLDDADWPASIAPMRSGFAGKLNVYRVMAYHPALLAAWAGLRNHVVVDSTLPADVREIVILRVAHRRQARYEWGQHVVRGRLAGLTDARIADCAVDPATLAPGRDRDVIEAVDMLLDVAVLAPERIGTLEAWLGRAGMFDLMATVGMYATLAFIANSFGTPLESDILAELGMAAE